MLLGMLADASDECLLLTRSFDKEAFRLEDSQADSNIQYEIALAFR